MTGVPDRPQKDLGGGQRPAVFGEKALRGSYFVRLNEAYNVGGWHEALNEALDLAMYWYREADRAIEAGRNSCYPMTPVDCLLSELRDVFASSHGSIRRETFEARVAEFRKEVEGDNG